jgi:hypothetical protein
VGLIPGVGADQADAQAAAEVGGGAVVTSEGGSAAEGAALPLLSQELLLAGSPGRSVLSFPRKPRRAVPRR